MFKSKAPEKDQNAATNVAEVVGRTVQQQYSVVEQPPPRREPTTDAVPRSCIGSGMSIVGNIECKGPAQVFGRIKGELRASDLLIGDGAEIEGNVIAQDVTVCGRVKGTIHAVRVKLQNGGSVEGDIFHRSLSIDENSLFEGSSRRVENPIRICSALRHRDPLTGPSRRLSRSISARVPEIAHVAPGKRISVAILLCDLREISSTASARAEMPRAPRD